MEPCAPRTQVESDFHARQSQDQAIRLTGPETRRSFRWDRKGEPASALGSGCSITLKYPTSGLPVEPEAVPMPRVSGRLFSNYPRLPDVVVTRTIAVDLERRPLHQRTGAGAQESAGTDILGLREFLELLPGRIGAAQLQNDSHLHSNLRSALWPLIAYFRV